VTDWRESAACRGADLTIFFPDTRGIVETSNAAAEEICRHCPVRRECLEFELAKGLPQHGWFGGKSADDRAAIIRKRKRRRAAA
jgi:WhiB family transcriptional regulator, redox-sensing transcriptional regulator